MVNCSMNLALAMSKMLTIFKKQLILFALLRVTGTGISLRGRRKGGMVETLFHGTLSLELQSEEWVPYTYWRKNE